MPFLIIVFRLVCALISFVVKNLMLECSFVLFYLWILLLWCCLISECDCAIVWSSLWSDCRVGCCVLVNYFERINDLELKNWVCLHWHWISLETHLSTAVSIRPVKCQSYMKDIANTTMIHLPSSSSFRSTHCRSIESEGNAGIDDFVLINAVTSTTPTNGLTNWLKSRFATSEDLQTFHTSTKNQNLLLTNLFEHPLIILLIIFGLTFIRRYIWPEEILHHFHYKKSPGVIWEAVIIRWNPPSNGKMHWIFL